jgi:lysophospholipase L1-like esterase
MKKKQLLLLILIVISFFILIEVSARVLNIFLDRHPLVQLPLPMPHVFLQTINPNKDPNEIRILCLGDSVTYGSQLKDSINSSYPALLQDMLHRYFPDIQSICYNGGEPASTTFVALDRFKDKMQEIKPDILTLAFGINDSYAVNENPDHINSLRTRSPSFKLNLLLEKSTAYYLMERALIKLKFKFLAKDPKSMSNMRVPPENFRENLVEFMNRAKKIGSKVILINEWTAGGLRTQDPATMDCYRAIVKSVADEYKTGYIDLKDIYESRKKEFSDEDYKSMVAKFDADAPKDTRSLVFKRPEISHLFYDPWHPDEEAHAMIARTLCKEIMRQNFIH